MLTRDTPQRERERARRWTLEHASEGFGVVRFMADCRAAFLRNSFLSRHAVRENHVKRLEKVFQLHGKEAAGVNCPAIDGIIEEANE
jgi:hypothetical protein